MNEQVCGDHALLQSLAEGTLATGDAQIVKSHVAACPACRAAVSQYKQVMWDLAHPPEVELPIELDRSYDALMQAWKQEHQSAPARASGTWVPAWAAYSVTWTRNLPAAGTVRSIVLRTGSVLLERSRPRWMRRKGGGRH